MERKPTPVEEIMEFADLAYGPGRLSVENAEEIVKEIELAADFGLGKHASRAIGKKWPRTRNTPAEKTALKLLRLKKRKI